MTTPPPPETQPSLEGLAREIEELRRAKANLEAVMEAATDAIFSVDREARVLTANTVFAKRMSEAAGRPVAAGTSLRELFPEHSAAWAAPIQRGFEGVPSQFEFVFPRPGGSVGQYLVSVRPVLGEGEVRAVIIFSRDVTEQRRNAQALAELDRLAAVGTVAAGVAHEIANPLTFVLSNLDASISALGKSELADRDPVPRVRQLLNDARYGAQRIHDVVKDLRSFSRPDDPVHAPISLAHVVDRALTMAQGEIRGRARVEREHEEGVPRVLGSEGRLSQVALNLLVNAAQALPEGPSDHVIRSVIRRDGADVVFEVIDTGGGLSSEALERAFEPFFTTKAKGAGTGLGLSISKQIVVAHRGVLSLANRPEGGAIARVRLPAC